MQTVTQISLVLLLFGTLCGDIALLADTGRIAAGDLFPGGAPEWLVAGDGRTVMAALVIVVVLPLSCMRRMREV
jgi:sodium-coupled neutral amino acid transporter 11